MFTRTGFLWFPLVEIEDLGGLEAETIPEKADAESQKSLEGRASDEDALDEVDVVAATGFFDGAEDLGGSEAGTAPEKADTESTRSLEDLDSLGRALDEDALDEVDVVAATGFFDCADCLEFVFGAFVAFDPKNKSRCIKQDNLLWLQYYDVLKNIFIFTFVFLGGFLVVSGVVVFWVFRFVA